MNKSTTIKVINIDKDKITGIQIGDIGNIEEENGNKIIDIPINRSIYLALLAEMKKANIIVDEELKCFDNRIFTIFERKWKDIPTPIWGAALRKDLEYLV